MNHIIIDKSNFWKVLDEFYSKVSQNNAIIVNYELKNIKETKLNDFFAKIKKDPIKSNLNPLTFQQDERKKWG